MRSAESSRPIASRKRSSGVFDAAPSTEARCSTRLSGRRSSSRVGTAAGVRLRSVLLRDRLAAGTRRGRPSPPTASRRSRAGDATADRGTGPRSRRRDGEEARDGERAVVLPAHARYERRDAAEGEPRSERRRDGAAQPLLRADALATASSSRAATSVPPSRRGAGEILGRRVDDQSAPCASGCCQHGVGSVCRRRAARRSRARGRKRRRCRSRGIIGFDGVSMKTTRVEGRSAAASASGRSRSRRSPRAPATNTSSASAVAVVRVVRGTT